jgi:hypothetical protein
MENYTTNSQELLHEYQIIPVYHTIVNKVGIEMYKLLNDMLPSFYVIYLKDIYSLRQGITVKLKLPRTTKYGKLCYALFT